MKCPICNKPSKVLDVRERKNETKVRRRQCKNGHDFISYEVSYERMSVLLDYEKGFLKVRSIVEDYE